MPWPKQYQHCQNIFPQKNLFTYLFIKKQSWCQTRNTHFFHSESVRMTQINPQDPCVCYYLSVSLFTSFIVSRKIGKKKPLMLRAQEDTIALWHKTSISNHSMSTFSFTIYGQWKGGKKSIPCSSELDFFIVPDLMAGCKYSMPPCKFFLWMKHMYLK